MNRYFIFDGNCDFCLRLAMYLKKYTSDIEFISYHDLKETDLLNIHSELSYEKCQGEVQFVYNGIRYPGFFAFRKLLHFTKKYKYLVFLLYLPLVPFMGMFLFVLLKKIRHKL